ncbi:MAG: hypothetical protein AVDCRST_MAG56-3519, partial [uncultured Cytophagales bacterium]
EKSARHYPCPHRPAAGRNYCLREYHRPRSPGRPAFRRWFQNLEGRQHYQRWLRPLPEQLPRRQPLYLRGGQCLYVGRRNQKMHRHRSATADGHLEPEQFGAFREAGHPFLPLPRNQILVCLPPRGHQRHGRRKSGNDVCRAI